MRLATLAASLLLLLTPAARAVPITAYVQGTITQANYNPNPGGIEPFRFVVGTPVYLAITFDPALAVDQGGGRYELRPTSFGFITPTGLSGTGGSGLGTDSALVQDGATDGVGFLLGGPTGSLGLVFRDASGTAISGTALPTIADLLRFPLVTVNFTREVGRGSDGFDATGFPVATPVNFPMPEPSGLALGLIGMGLMGFMHWRKRR